MNDKGENSFMKIDGEGFDLPNNALSNWFNVAKIFVPLVCYTGIK